MVSLTLSTEQLVRMVGEISSEEVSWYNRLGWLTPKEVFEEYSNSILVFPSLVESLGLPLYEAREAGIWIVAGNTAFSREALEGYPLVKWFEPTNASSLAVAMQDAWDASRLGRVRVPSAPDGRSSWDIMIEELELLFGN